MAFVYDPKLVNNRNQVVTNTVGHLGQAGNAFDKIRQAGKDLTAQNRLADKIALAKANREEDRMNILDDRSNQRDYAAELLEEKKDYAREILLDQRKADAILLGQKREYLSREQQRRNNFEMRKQGANNAASMARLKAQLLAQEQRSLKDIAGKAQIERIKAAAKTAKNKNGVIILGDVDSRKAWDRVIDNDLINKGFDNVVKEANAGIHGVTGLNEMHKDTHRILKSQFMVEMNENPTFKNDFLVSVRQGNSKEFIYDFYTARYGQAKTKVNSLTGTLNPKSQPKGLLKQQLDKEKEEKENLAKIQKASFKASITNQIFGGL